MKRLALILGLVLLFALAACDTMGPQEALPTTGVGTTVAGEATAAPVEATAEVPAESEGETAATPGAEMCIRDRNGTRIGKNGTRMTRIKRMKTD